MGRPQILWQQQCEKEKEEKGWETGILIALVAEGDPCGCISTESLGHVGPWLIIGLYALSHFVLHSTLLR